MISKNADKKGQVQLVSLDQLVPEDHILRKIDKYIDFSFIYELVEEKYWRTLIVCGVCLLLNIFIFALANQYMEEYSQLLLTG